MLRDLTDSFFDVRIRRLEQAGGGSDPDVAALIDHLRRLKAQRASEIQQTIDDIRGYRGDTEPLDASTVRTTLAEGADEVDSEPPEGVDAADLLSAVHDANDQSDVHQALDDQVARILRGEPGDPDGDTNTDASSDSPASTPSVSASPPDAETGSPGYEDNELDLRPLRFVNDSFVLVTVRAETYEPAPDLAGTPMSQASTVVTVDPNPSAYLDLPRGRYTFCYDWDLGDVDGDGLNDHAHRSSGSTTLTSDTSRDPLLAPTVTLSPPSSTSSPNGRCPTAAVDPVGALTAAQRAATTSATYTVTCDYSDGSAETFSKEYWFDFDEGAAVWNDAAAAPVELRAIDINQYEFAQGGYRLDLTDSGFDLFSLVGDDPQFCRAVRTGQS